jgi:hypothetical protein
MARFIGWLTSQKGSSDSSTSRTSAQSIDANARGWNIGGSARVHAAQDDTKQHSRDSVKLAVDGGSTGTLAGCTVAWIVETEGKPALHIHLPRRYIMEHDFSSVTLIDDETNAETVIYTAPAAEEK